MSNDYSGPIRTDVRILKVLQLNHVCENCYSASVHLLMDEMYTWFWNGVTWGLSSHMLRIRKDSVKRKVSL